MASITGNRAPLAEELAETARGMALTSLEKGLDFSSKEDGTPETETDQSIERVLREMISKRFPGHGILGEEYGSVDEDFEFVWVLDPIDGTKSFASGLPTFGSLIALCQYGLPVLGVVELPIMRHRCVGAVGRQTTLNGVPVRTRAKQDIANCVMATAGVEFFKPPAPAENFYDLMSSTNWNVYGGEPFFCVWFALTLNIAARVAVVMRGAITGVASGVTEAGAALGLKPRQRFT